MTGHIANTDQKWFEFLRSLPPQEEVNFWNPSDHYLFRGPIGSPFLFRLKAPVNAIGGFGIVSWADRMPEWLAWECFGQGNGAPTLDAMRMQIARLRKSSEGVRCSFRRNSIIAAAASAKEELEALRPVAKELLERMKAGRGMP